MDSWEQRLRFFRLAQYPGFGWILAAGSVAIAMFSVAQIVIPLILGAIVDNALLAEDVHALGRLAFFLAFTATVSMIFRGISQMAFRWSGQRSLIRLRERMLERLFRMPGTYFDQMRSGKIHALFVEDAPSVARWTDSVASGLIMAVVQAIALTGILVTKYGWLSLAALPLIPVYLLFPLVFSRRIRRASKRLMEARSEMSSRLQEIVQGVREVKIFHRGTWVIDRIRSLMDDVLRRHMHLTLLRSSRSLNYGLSFLVGSLVYWFGGLQVLEGELSVGSLVALVALLSYVENPVNSVVSLNLELQAVLASAERLEPLLTGEAEEAMGKLGEAPGPGPYSLQVDDVSFTYPGAAEAALRNVSFEIEPGCRVALVGPSGAGKSTLVRLIARWYVPGSGTLRLQGKDIESFDVGALRRSLGYVTQQPVLFSGTVRENLLFGRPAATDEEIREAAEVANAHGFIEELPEGYNTDIGDRGANLSGGQRQRLAIARVVLRNPGLLLLDEATSSLDAESELAVRGALDQASQGRTLLTIAHRLATVVDADWILLLDEGRLVAQGTHEDLLERAPLYRRLCELQFDLPQTETTAAGGS